MCGCSSRSSVDVWWKCLHVVAWTKSSRLFLWSPYSSVTIELISFPPSTLFPLLPHPRLSLSLSLHRATLGVWANRPISQPAFRSQQWIRLNHKLNSVLWYCRDWEGLKSIVQRDTEVDEHIERSRKTETGNIKREENVYNVKTQRGGERVKK